MNHDFNERLAALEESEADEEIVIREEVVATPWEPNDSLAEVPTPGVSVTRHYRDESGNWTSEGDG